MDRASNILLELLRASLGTSPVVPNCLSEMSKEEWERLINMSFEGGVVALAVDGYNSIIKHSDNCLLESEEMEDLKFDWFGSFLQAEEDYGYKFKRAARFASALSKKGVECKVLKGMSFGTYYTRPEHRECTDCDVYLGCRDWETGNETILEIGGRYKFGTYKHSHLFLGQLMIENHRYLTDFNGTRQGKRIERLLEEVITEGQGRKIGDSMLVCPNDHFNALFLIKHAHGNFMYGGLSLRMVYDWAALLLSCGQKLDWKRIWAELDVCRLSGFAKVMDSLCVDYLGIPADLVDGLLLCSDKALVDEIMNDTLNGGIYTKGDETFLQKCVRIGKRFARIWHYRALATESVPKMIWNNFAFSSYLKRRIEM